MYCIINKDTKRIEGAYDDYSAAEIMMRNLNERYTDASFTITTGTTEDRPTSRQMYRIKQIENECNVVFQGITKTEAKLFLDKYLSKLE
jgi:hypothetical protein